MKKLLLNTTMLFALLIMASFGTAQEISDRYITIIGQSEYTVDHEALKLEVQLQEIEQNEYQKIRGKSLDEVKAELISAITPLGLGQNDLAEVFPPKTAYGNKKTESYTIKVKDENTAKKLYKMGIKGLKVTNLNYIFPEVEVDDFMLSKKALADAERKAKALAKEVGLKLGDVMSIEDVSGSGNSYIPSYKDRNNKSKKYTYKIRVTYDVEQ